MGAAASTHSLALDALRGLAALAVVAFHARVLFFVARADVQDHGAVAAVFYLVTAFGREAVLAFFVLSGYLIASSIQRDVSSGSWSPGGYAAARLSRLYVVFVPAIAVGLAWDVLGLKLFGSAAVYTGTLANGEFPVQVAANIGLANVLGALAFVQAIYLPSPGSSAQYWSLAYEFWCYALFPLVYFALASGVWWRRALLLAAAAAIAALLGRDVIAYLGIWLLGAAVALWPMRPSRAAGGVLIAIGALVVVACLYFILAQQLRMPGSGFGVAIGVALMIGGCKALDRAPTGIWAGHRLPSAVRWLADRSYSLYAIHVPLLVFVRAWCGEWLWQPTALNMLAWLGLVGLSLAYAHLFWLASERHTAKVRRWLVRLIARPSRTRIVQLRASS